MTTERFEIEIVRTSVMHALVLLGGETIGRAFYYSHARAPKKWGAQVWTPDVGQYMTDEDLPTLFRTDTEAAFELVRYVSDKRKAAAIIASMNLEGGG